MCERERERGRERGRDRERERKRKREREWARERQKTQNTKREKLREKVSVRKKIWKRYYLFFLILLIVSSLVKWSEKWSLGLSLIIWAGPRGRGNNVLFWLILRIFLHFQILEWCTNLARKTVCKNVLIWLRYSKSNIGLWLHEKWRNSDCCYFSVSCPISSI